MIKAVERVSDTTVNIASDSSFFIYYLKFHLWYYRKQRQLIRTFSNNRIIKMKSALIKTIYGYNKSVA